MVLFLSSGFNLFILVTAFYIIYFLYYIKDYIKVDSMSIYKNIGIYIHVPFCVKKCPYCDFYSVAYDHKSNLEKQYFESLIEEIKSYKAAAKKNKLLVDTIYFGGGTPSIVDSVNIKNVLNTVKHTFKNKNLEITLEINPGTVDEKYLIDLEKMGINRLSFGLQSANDDELYILGRSHLVNEAKIAIDSAKKVGFKNISVDLILGIPNQTLDKVKTSLEFIEKLDISHVSAYIIQIEKNTLFNKQSIIEKIPNEDLMADIYLYTVDKLKKMGFNQYEISNFSKPGFESKHNFKYWNRNEYIGFGPAAHSFFGDKRYYLDKNIYKYIGMGQNKQFNYIDEKNDNIINEYIMLKLRTCSGISLIEMREIYPRILVEEFLNNIKKYYNEKYIYMDENIVKLTPEGFLIYNTIVSNIMID